MPPLPRQLSRRRFALLTLATAGSLGLAGLSGCGRRARARLRQKEKDEAEFDERLREREREQREQSQDNSSGSVPTGKTAAPAA